MLTKIKLLKNIGAFRSDSGGSKVKLGNLVLVTAENGRGKTTISAILRSLSKGDQDLVNERRRLGSPSQTHIVFECDGSQSAIQFQNGNWNLIIPQIKIFRRYFR